MFSLACLQCPSARPLPGLLRLQLTPSGWAGAVAMPTGWAFGCWGLGESAVIDPPTTAPAAPPTPAPMIAPFAPPTLLPTAAPAPPPIAPPIAAPVLALP